MLLVRAQISYFRQYKKTEIFFPENGMIGILGVNGSGKSTLFNAIQWALYGKIKDITNSMIKNQSAGKKDPCFVEIDFVYQGQYYRVHRDLVSSRCFVQVDGRTRALGTTSVNQFIEEEVFKMDHKTFCTCYYAEQDDFDALVKLNPGPRVQMLTKLVRIETIDDAIELTRKDRRSLEYKVIESRKRLRDGAALEVQKNTFASQLINLRKQIKNCEDSIARYDESYKDLLVKKAEGEGVYRKFVALSSYIQKEETERNNLEKLVVTPSEQKLAQMEKEKLRLENLLPQVEPMAGLVVKKEKMSSLQAEFQKKNQIISDVKRVELEAKQYEEQVKVIEAQLKADANVASILMQKEETAAELSQKVTLLREAFQELAHDAKTKKAAIAEKEETKKRFDTLGEEAPCPTCERPLGEHYGDKTTHLSQEIDALRSELSGINEKGSAIRSQGEESKKQYDVVALEIEGLRKQFIENEKREERLASSTLEKENRRSFVQDLKKRYEEVKNVEFDAEEYGHISIEIQRLSPLSDEIIKLQERIGGIANLEIQIRDAKNNMTVHEDAIKGFVRDQNMLKFNEEAYNLLGAQVEEAQQQKVTTMEEKTTIATAIAVEEGKLRGVEEKIEENTLIEAEIKVDEVEIVFLGKLDKVFAAYKIDKLSKLAPALSDIMSNLMDRITDGKYDRVELDDSYNIQIYRAGIKNPLEFYSGGEKKLAALCQRLAISNLLVSQAGQGNFEMLAMDEVFGAMDNARQDGLLEMLRNLNEVFPQILMVTHSDYVKDSFDHVLEVKTDGNGYSVASWETQWDDSLVKAKVEAYNQSLDEDETQSDEDEAV